MIDNSIEILKFNADNSSEFRKLISSLKVPKEFDIINGYSFVDQIIFIMLNKKSKSFFFRYIEKNEIIGYCIVENTDLNLQRYGKRLGEIYQIEDEILNSAPIVISDFMINKKYRHQRLGTKFANYIINTAYKSENLSLHADGDGLYFWDKIGFKFVEGFEPNMVLLRN